MVLANFNLGLANGKDRWQQTWQLSTVKLLGGTAWSYLVHARHCLCVLLGPQTGAEDSKLGATVPVTMANFTRQKAWSLVFCFYVIFHSFVPDNGVLHRAATYLTSRTAWSI